MSDANLLKRLQHSKVLGTRMEGLLFKISEKFQSHCTTCTNPRRKIFWYEPRHAKKSLKDLVVVIPKKNQQNQILRGRLGHPFRKKFQRWTFSFSSQLLGRSKFGVVPKEGRVQACMPSLLLVWKWLGHYFRDLLARYCPYGDCEIILTLCHHPHILFFFRGRPYGLTLIRTDTAGRHRPSPTLVFTSHVSGRGNIFGSVRVSVRPSVCALQAEPLDLQT